MDITAGSDLKNHHSCNFVRNGGLLYETGTCDDIVYYYVYILQKIMSAVGI